METPTIYNKVAYQTIDLTKDPTVVIIDVQTYTINKGGPPAHNYEEIETFINKNYNLIEGFFFDYPEEIAIKNVLIEEFKIDDLEILPSNFPIDFIKSGHSMSFQQKFIPLNIPIRQGKLKIRLRNIIGAAPIYNKINLVFKLNNVKDESVFYKDYYKYQIETFRIETPFGDIKKFDFRPKYNVQNLIGVGTKVLGIVPANVPKNQQLGMLKLSINSKKSNPINIPIYEHTTPNIKYKPQFLELNEPIEKGSAINAVFALHESATIPSVLSASLCNVILKYKI